MIADLLVFLFCAGTAVFFVIPALWAEIKDCHHRGIARVHRGRSWSQR